MRRSGLLIGSLFLACGASLALAAPASAAVGTTSGHPHNWYCDDDYYGNYGNYDYYHYNPYHHRHHHHHHGLFGNI